MTDIEDRLRVALREVADRIDDDELVMARPRRPGGRLLTGAVAAAIVAVFAGVQLAGGGDAEEAPGATEDATMNETAEDDALVTATVDGYVVELRVVDDCVRATTPDAELDLPIGCLAAGDLVLVPARASGPTVVYGLGRGDEVEATTAGSQELEQARSGSLVAFMLVIDQPFASGSVAVFSAGSLVAEERFDDGGSARGEKGNLGDASVVFAYAKDGAIWAYASDGRHVRLTDGVPTVPDRSPTVAPDGRRIHFWSERDSGVFSRSLVVDARTGEAVEAPFAPTFSPDGRWAVGGIPKDDMGVSEFVVIDGDLGRPRYVQVDPDSGSVAWAASWDVGSDRFLATTVCCDGWTLRLWFVDAASGTVEPVELASPEAGRQGALADEAAGPGRFAFLQRSGDELLWGALVVEGDRATYEAAPIDPATPEATLDHERLWVDRSRWLLEPDGDGGFDVEEATEPTYLVGDGTNLFQLTESGELTFLLAGVERAGAP